MKRIAFVFMTMTALTTFFLAATHQDSNENIDAIHYSERISEAIALKDPKVIDIARSGTTLYPNSVMIHRMYQNLLIQSNRREEAKKEYKSLLLTHAQDANYLYLYGRLLENDEYEKAMIQVLRVNQECHWARRGLGNYLKNNKRFKEAAFHYEHLIQHRDTVPFTIYRSLAICYHYTDQFEKEEVLLLQAHKKYPLITEPYLMLGVLYKTVGQYEEAITYLKRVHFRDPSEVKVYEPLIQSYFLAKRDHDAHTLRKTFKTHRRLGTFENKTLPQRMIIQVITLEPYILTVSEQIGLLSPNDEIFKVDIRYIANAKPYATIALTKQMDGFLLVKRTDQTTDVEILNELQSIPSYQNFIVSIKEIIRSKNNEKH